MLADQMAELAAALKAHNDREAAALARLQEEVARAAALKEASEALMAQANAILPAPAPTAVDEPTPAPLTPPPAETDEDILRRVDERTARGDMAVNDVEMAALLRWSERAAIRPASTVGEEPTPRDTAEAAPPNGQTHKLPAKKPRQKKAKASKNGT